MYQQELLIQQRIFLFVTKVDVLKILRAVLLKPQRPLWDRVGCTEMLCVTGGCPWSEMT
jgi:hypothetical protein